MLVWYVSAESRNINLLESWFCSGVEGSQRGCHGAGMSVAG